MCPLLWIKRLLVSELVFTDDNLFYTLLFLEFTCDLVIVCSPKFILELSPQWGSAGVVKP